MHYRSAALILSVSLFACQTPRQHVPAADPALPFSSGVLVGDTFWAAGHLGLDPTTRRAPADPAEEARLMLDAFAATLAKVGMTMDDLVQVQVFCSDVELYDTFNAIYRERFTRAFPSRAFLGSGTLLRGARFEIQGVAVRR
jgi:enamine deaminase RidA (YjgF/YER057c/UK114 family)